MRPPRGMRGRRISQPRARPTTTDMFAQARRGSGLRVRAWSAESPQRSHRDQINAGVKTALGLLNGTDGAAVSMMTGLRADELDELGGLPN